MPISLIGVIHVLTATLGLASGALAMLFRKGSGLHGAAGTVFFVSMLTMSATGAYHSAFVKPIPMNVLGGLLTFYLVATGGRAARRRDGQAGAFDRAAMLFILAVGLYGVASGFRADAAAPVYFVFGSAALLCGIADFRMLGRGGVSGGSRIVRHLWRMCAGFLIGLLSLYPGQAQLFPDWLRETRLLFVPHVLLIGSMFYRLVRMSVPQLERRKKMRFAIPVVVLILAVLPATTALAQESPLSANEQFRWGVLKKMVLRAAEVMPEEHYAFRPTDKVRTFGQVVGHVADAQYRFCSAALAEKPPAPQVEKTKASKADLMAALNEAFAYCDRAYGALTDATAQETVKYHRGDWPKLSVLSTNDLHTTEHYGNLVTYLRMKDIVPPTSDPEFMAKATQ